MKIDLQIHTTFSDGKDTPEQIAQKAHEGGLNVISVTDHDRVDSYEVVSQACAQYGLKNIPGVEISTTYEGKAIHVLGYNFDPNSEELKSFLRNINHYRKEKFLQLFPLLNDALREAGKPEADIEKYKDRDPKWYAFPGLSMFLVEQGITKDKNEGFQYFKYMKGTTPPVTPKDAFEIIHKAGGKAILSHPFAPRIALTNITPDRAEQEKLVWQFKEWGMDGLECYQAGHNADDVAFCLEMAAKYNLLITAGSDWHGHHTAEETGIRDYLPYYIEKLGDLEVPEDKAQSIIDAL